MWQDNDGVWRSPENANLVASACYGDTSPFDDWDYFHSDDEVSASASFEGG